ncbi:hypothetical protein TNIN_247331 [Trichonephila inaurata madagascariensis]|uniref:Uncharacterized protein n=1 Tax=Trichonephila inaurata madagascariensis TaxID=2747483 RepID=A0A8X6YFH3_9ARAC|nr:hypothetical protein TNIN_353821 [Trichonephila inaurata madagascariensis]GFY71067.1 hypothetical protein TNIN_247331 [Trichonephila inaurata madagascariensis]
MSGKKNHVIVVGSHGRLYHGSVTQSRVSPSQGPCQQLFAAHCQRSRLQCYAGIWPRLSRILLQKRMSGIIRVINNTPGSPYFSGLEVNYASLKGLTKKNTHTQQ